MVEPLHTVPSRSLVCSIDEPWKWTTAKLEVLATTLGGEREGGWVRQGNARVTIARRHWSAKAFHLDRELIELSDLAAKIRDSDSPHSVIEAIAFFHCRFELIHPLHDGNGRTGRLIMAAQAEDQCRITRKDFLSDLHAHENDYRMTFVPDDFRMRYELMVDLVARLSGVTPPTEGIKLPFPIAPRFPEKKTKPGKSISKPKPNRPFWKRRF